MLLLEVFGWERALWRGCRNGAGFYEDWMCFTKVCSIARRLRGRQAFFQGDRIVATGRPESCWDERIMAKSGYEK